MKALIREAFKKKDKYLPQRIIIRVITNQLLIRIVRLNLLPGFVSGTIEDDLSSPSFCFQGNLTDFFDKSKKINGTSQKVFGEPIPLELNLLVVFIFSVLRCCSSLKINLLFYIILKYENHDITALTGGI